MSEEGPIASLYPNPPPYIQFFTEENLEKLNEYKKEKDFQLQEQDKDLEFLIPPKQPDTEVYRSFGNIWHFNDKNPKLEDVGIPQLYKENELSLEQDSKLKIGELKKLLRSLLLNFVEVIGVMSVAPQEFPSKVEQIRTILINIHHLLNEYRPHQSRESLILLLEKQIDTKKSEINNIEKICKEVEDKIRSLVALHVDNEKENKEQDKENKDQDKDWII